MVASPRQIPGSNAGRSRLWNRSLVLGHVRAQGRAGRAEIARACGLSIQALSNIIADLVAEGMLREAGRRCVGRGLPTAQYALAPGGGHALGVELRPDVVRAALLDLTGAPLWTVRRALHDARPDAVADALAELRDAALAATGADPARLLGVGVVMPGPFGATGLSDRATELPGWAGVAAQPLFEARLGLPALVENDANAAVVAERLWGAARGVENVALLYFGAGLGLGVIAEGRLLRGGRGNAGEIGHIPFSGVRLESVASRHALGRALAAAGLPHQTVEDIDRAMTDGAPALTDWIARAAAMLSPAVAMVENLFDPDLVILGGALPDAVLDALAAGIALSDASLAHRPGRSSPRLMRGAAGRMVAALGAGALVLDHAFTPRLQETAPCP